MAAVPPPPPPQSDDREAEIAILVDASGFRNFEKKLEQMDPEILKRFRTLNKKIATRVSNQTKREWIRAGRAGARAGKVAGTVVGISTGQGVAVTIKAPQSPSGATKNKRSKMLSLGAEFGAKQYRQFNEFAQPRWVNGWPVSGGYGVHEVIRKRGGWIRDQYLANVLAVAKEAGMDTTGVG